MLRIVTSICCGRCDHVLEGEQKHPQQHQKHLPPSLCLALANTSSRANFTAFLKGPRKKRGTDFILAAWWERWWWRRGGSNRASSSRSTVWGGWTLLVDRISHRRGLWGLVTRGANTVKSTATSTGVVNSVPTFTRKSGESPKWHITPNFTVCRVTKERRNPCIPQRTHSFFF